MAAADPLQEVLTQIVDFAASLVSCDSCFLYALEDGELVLRASKNADPDVLDRMKLRQGITGWVVEHKQPVAVALNASQDPRLQLFKDLAEDRFEAFLSVPVLCRGRVVGVINLQNREPHEYTEHEITLISTIGFLVGAEMEMARLESESLHLSEELETQKFVERAKGILQRELRVTEKEAYLRIQRQSRQRRKSMKEVAGAIVLSEDVKCGLSE
jgi:uroporphyrinogen-III synthase